MPAKLTKAVILARGLGKRMRRADDAAEISADQASVAESGVKAMIPIGRPFLDYVLSGLTDAGLRDICLVIGPEHNGMRDYYDRQKLRRVKLAYAIQPEPRGTADALLAAQEFAGDDEFLVMNSDNYYPVDVLRTLHEMAGPGVVLFKADALVRNSNIPAERVRAFAYCEVRDGLLAAVHEKPDAGAKFAPDALVSMPVSMNVWRFSPEIFEHCRRVPLSPRGEYELPMAVNEAVTSGMQMRVATSELGVLDLSQRSDISAVAKALQHVEVEL